MNYKIPKVSKSPSIVQSRVFLKSLKVKELWNKPVTYKKPRDRELLKVSDNWFADIVEQKTEPRAKIVRKKKVSDFTPVPIHQKVSHYEYKPLTFVQPVTPGGDYLDPIPGIGQFDNSDFVQRENIVWRKEDLPECEAVDLGPDMITAGDQVVAKWTEDGIWYNATVLGQEGLGYSVFFTDYENIAFVESEQIFQEVTDIPEGERLDIHLEILL